MPPHNRIGHGYDLHRLEPNGDGQPGRPLMLGGVEIQHDRGPIAHSDGDALLHAVTDALLGAIGAPDIGQLFPDNDPRNESGRDHHLRTPQAQPAQGLDARQPRRGARGC